MANSKKRGGAAALINRHFTKAGVHPFDEIEWENRTARIGTEDNPVFEQHNVEVPSFWSQNATNIVAQKYFAYSQDDPRRETSVRQMIDRVVSKITKEGIKHGYFKQREAKVFSDELSYILVHQLAAFNSPVWFNIGVKGAKQTASACFILSVEDTMESILSWYTEEGLIFRNGSGAGINLSNLRGSSEQLSKGGQASGPVSFMRGADASAGTIKSGGRTRRAAKLVCLDVDHPDIEEFIWCKAREEKRIRALAAAGFDMSMDSANLAEATAYQNANNSVRVSDDFMRAVEEDEEWSLIERTTGDVAARVKARDIFKQLSEAAWRCADPGIQYDTTINDWHTTPAQGKITSTNPCCFVGETPVITKVGPITIEELARRSKAGEEELPEAFSFEHEGQGIVLRRIMRAWKAGDSRRLVELRTDSGQTLRSTPEHRYLSSSGDWVEAQTLAAGDELCELNRDGLFSYGVVRVQEAVLVELDEPVAVYDLEVEGTHNFAVGTPGRSREKGIVVHNSEYCSNDDTSCNLASLNLLKFLDHDGGFDIAAYRHTAQVIFTAQEITIAFADFPTAKIGKRTKALRQVGIGYTNLGAMLMSLGLPYDSDAGREWAAAVTSLLTGESYLQSAKIAGRVGSFEHFDENRESLLAVLAKHREATNQLSTEGAPGPVVRAARWAWGETIRAAGEFGVRNAQASTLAPTGTISFLMDSDTFGVEPDFALLKHKTLVGGGTMQIVNRAIPRALGALGYSNEQTAEIISYLEEEIDRDGSKAARNSLVGAPHLKPEHYAVFDCAVGERSIEPLGHVRMMAAVQPFISGAISKTVNVPSSATVEDISEIYMQGWKLGLKALAVYRDASKANQPLASKKQQGKERSSDADPEQAAPSQLGQELLRGERRRMEREPEIIGVNFELGPYGQRVGGYIHVRLFEDGTPGALFVDVGQAGSTLHGFIRAWAVTFSLGLQYGVPLDTLVSKLAFSQFEPAGFTDDMQVRRARSIVDFVVRWLAARFLEPDVHQQLGILSIDEDDSEDDDGVIPGGEIAPKPQLRAATLPAGEAPSKPAALSLAAEQGGSVCTRCGGALAQTGACQTCMVCGETGGCG